jgi:hypothetical protein
MTQGLPLTEDYRETPTLASSPAGAGGRASVRARRLRRVVGSVPTWMRAFAFYLLLALFTIGWHELRHPATICACGVSTDPGSYMWALSWWPHALLHGLNPFYTHYLWSPTGVNVAQGAMIPTAAILMAPVTELAGSVVSYNVLSILSPALAAFTAYLLCRRLVGRELPAVAGGYLFGFSSYEFAQLTGHLNLVLTFLIPVMVHIALRRVNREISRRTYVLGMTALLILQAGLSTELLAECVGLGAVLLVSARFLAPRSWRSRIDGLSAETVGAGMIAIVLISPFLYYALFSGNFPQGDPSFSDAYGLDLLNPLIPTSTTWLGHHDFLSLSFTFEHGNGSETGGYLSIPIVIAFMLWLFRHGRERTLARLVAVAAGVSFVAALGAHMHIAGQQTVTLPINWVNELPVFDYIAPSRIMLFTALAVSIGVAAWLAMPSGNVTARWAVVLLGIVLIFPDLAWPSFGATPLNPSFFSTATYRHYLTRNETVLVLPFGGNDMSMLWQAETGFYFYMPEGYISSVIPYPFNTELAPQQLNGNIAPSAGALGNFIRQHVVSHVVVDAANAGPWPSLLAQLGLHGQPVGGVLLYTVPSAPG